MKKVDNESSMNADFNNQPNRSTNYNNQPMLNNGSISGRPMQGNPMPNNVQMQGAPMPNNRPMQGSPMPNNVQMQGAPMPNNRPMYGNPMPNNGPMNGNPFNNRAIPNNYLNENMNNNSDGIKKERTIESWIGTRGMVILASIMIVVSIVLFGKILFDDFEKVIVYSVLYTVFIGISLFGFIKSRKNTNDSWYKTIMCSGICATYFLEISTYKSFNLDFLVITGMFALWTLGAMALMYKDSIMSIIVTTSGTFFTINFLMIVGKMNERAGFVVMIYTALYVVLSIAINFKNELKYCSMIICSIELFYAYCAAIVSVVSSKSHYTMEFRICGVVLFGLLFIYSLVFSWKNDKTVEVIIFSVLTKIMFIITLYIYRSGFVGGTGYIIALGLIVLLEDIINLARNGIGEKKEQNLGLAYKVCKIVSDIIIFAMICSTIKVGYFSWFWHNEYLKTFSIEFYIVLTVLAIFTIIAKKDFYTIRFAAVMIVSTFIGSINLLLVRLYNINNFALVLCICFYAFFLNYIVMMFDFYRKKEHTLENYIIQYIAFFALAIISMNNFRRWYLGAKSFENNGDVVFLIGLTVIILMHKVLSIIKFYEVKQKSSIVVFNIIMRIADGLMYLVLVNTFVSERTQFNKLLGTVLALFLIGIDLIEVLIKKKVTSTFIISNAVKVYTVLIGVLISYSAKGYIVSIAIFVVSTLYVFIGFLEKFRSKMLRRAGLVMALLCVLKMMLYDLASGALLGYAIGFLVSGLLCALISFIYSYFEKKYIDVYENDKVEDDLKDKNDEMQRNYYDMLNSRMVPMGVNPGMQAPNGMPMNPGMNPRMNPGMNQGMNPGVNPGMQAPNGMPMNPGMNQGINPGVNPGMQAPNGMPMNPRMNPGMNQGINPGVNPGMQNPNGVNPNNPFSR